MDYIITDGNGYWVKMRRIDGRILHLWSPRKKDAARFHFIEVAQRVATHLDQQVSIRMARP